MFNRLLVGIDLSPSTPVTLEFATGLALANRSSVHVVHVNPLAAGRRLPSVPADEAAELLRNALRQLGEAGITATTTLARATEARLAWSIAQAARAEGADAIVLGSRRQRHLGRLVGHGIRERVTSLSPLPVLIAPPALQFPRRRHLGSERKPALVEQHPTPVG